VSRSTKKKIPVCFPRELQWLRLQTDVWIGKMCLWFVLCNPLLDKVTFRECCFANWLKIPNVCCYILAAVYGEFTKVSALRQKLESLCRELQRQNKILLVNILTCLLSHGVVINSFKCKLLWGWLSSNDFLSQLCYGSGLCLFKGHMQFCNFLCML
jgi:hypothetical protein